jgi:chemotaxis methyl-accepting protein methylase
LDFEQFRVFLEKACGILLGENKQYLVSSRLNKLMEQQGIKYSASRPSRAAVCASRWSMP